MTATTTTAAPRPATAPQTTSDGRGIDMTAAVTTTHDLLIEAPVDVVWQLQTEIEEWPTWQPSVLSAVRLDQGRLASGSRFEWTTPVPDSPISPSDTLLVSSEVDHVEHHRSLLWHGPAVGAFLRVDAGVHLWTFTEVAGGTQVHTEESWAGPMVDVDVELATAALSASLESWLHHLKVAAEAR